MSPVLSVQCSNYVCFGKAPFTSDDDVEDGDDDVDDEDGDVDDEDLDVDDEDDDLLELIERARQR